MSELPVGELAARCREHTARFLRGESRDDAYGFEMFQRAVVHHDEAAWDAVIAQYRGIAIAYVRQHPAAALLHESDDFWVNRAFQRFWSAVCPERFDQFPDLAALLKYLKLCVHSALIDELRSCRAVSLTSLEDIPESTPASPDAEAGAIGSLVCAELWRVIMRELQDEAEEKVMYLSLAHDLKPGEIASRYPRLFSSVADVYRIKRNVIERLRRNTEVRAFLAVTCSGRKS